jgi:hypothetical protein
VAILFFSKNETSMIVPALPHNEEMRIVELSSYNLQNTDTEQDFNDLSALAAKFFKCPIALITVIDSNRQWFKGKTGTTETGNSRELSFCGHTLLQDEVMVVEDATNDDRFFDNPFVTGDFKIRFYAGAPIVSEDGFKLGTVCLYDTKKKKLSKAKRNALLLFSKQVSQLLTLRKKNILLHQQAAEIIRFKSETIAHYIQCQESDKKEIAYNLDEDFAQGIAASMIILQLAQGKDQDQGSLINKAIGQLKDVVTKIRHLSYDISPHFIDWLSSDELLRDFIEKKAVGLPYNINVSFSGKPSNCSTQTTLSALRIIEQWLQLLSKKTNPGLLQINILYEDKLVLIFKDEDTLTSLATRKKDVTEIMMTTNAQVVKGIVEFSFADSGMNQLKIILPLSL